ncbi:MULTISPECIES: ATP-binding protein [unclassified Streptomyces]|uniref:histidine kinase n=2 Tax=Streptomyces TaxID=1883 RepID=A0ABW9HWI0_9ACTN|nr:MULTISPECIES: ATP-binding protein [unclassified Streptomyces]
MVSAQSSTQSPPGRERPLARVLLPPAILMTAVSGAALALVPRSARVAVGVCGAVATVLVVMTAVEVIRRGRRLRELRADTERRTAALERRIEEYATLNLRVVEDHIPTAVKVLRAGNSPREVLQLMPDIDPTFRDLDRAQAGVVTSVLDIVEHQENLRDSALRSYTSVARRIQAIVHQQNDELLEMEYDHGNNPHVFDDLLRIDHGTAMIGRLADSVGVIGGGRPSRQWPAPVPLYSVLRGGMSRILEYPRIKLESIAKVNIRGISVEPVIHACAELMDNATRFSPPASTVHVNAIEVQTGIAIEIEDAGVSLSEEGRARVERILEDAKRGEDIHDDGGAPQLGLAVVGRLCTTFNMQCSLRVSAYGGVRAVLIVPAEMLTEGPETIYAHGIGAGATPTLDLGGIKGPQRRPKKRRPTSPRLPEGVSMEEETPEVTEWTAEGLPQRRSKAVVSILDSYPEAYRRQLAEEAAEKAAAERGEPVPVDEEEEMWAEAAARVLAKPAPSGPAPGLGFEAFWAGLKDNTPEGVHPTDFTRNPTAYLHLIDDKATADDEGDPT